MNTNAIKCYANLRAIRVSHSFARAIARHMPQADNRQLREVSPDMPVTASKPETQAAMTIQDGYCVNRFYQS